MKSRRQGQDESHENNDRWLLTYSDLITLLLALFIILYAISTVDQQKYKVIAQSMSQAFNAAPQEGATDNTPGAGEQKDKSATGYSGAAAQSSPLDKIYQQLHTYVQQKHLENTIDLEKTSTYIRITVKDVLLFKPDSPTMLDASKPILGVIGKSLQNVYSEIDHVTISGHTADPSNDQNYSSDFAWSLSTNRAVTVLQYLVDNGLPQNKLSIEGYSHFDPIANNKTEKGRAQNRRVEITVTRNTPKTTASSVETAATQASGTSSDNTSSSKTSTSSGSASSGSTSSGSKTSTSSDNTSSSKTSTSSGSKTSAATKANTNPYTD